MKKLTSEQIKERVIKGLKATKLISSNYRSVFYQGAIKNQVCSDFNNVVYFSDNNNMNDDLSIKLDNYHVDNSLVDVSINIESDLLDNPKIYDIQGSYKCKYMNEQYKDLCIVRLTKEQIETFANITKSNVLSFIKNIYVLDNDVICCTQQTVTKVSNVNYMHDNNIEGFKNGIPLSYSVLNILKQFALKGENLIYIKYNEQTKHLQISMNTLPFSIYISYECAIGNSSYINISFTELIKRQQSKEHFTISYQFIKNAIKDLTTKQDLKDHNAMIDLDDQSVGLASSDDLYWHRVKDNCLLIRCEYINLFKKLDYTDARICENNIVFEGSNTMTLIMKLIK